MEGDIEDGSAYDYIAPKKESRPLFLPQGFSTARPQAGIPAPKEDKPKDKTETKTLAPAPGNPASMKEPAVKDVSKSQVKTEPKSLPKAEPQKPGAAKSEAPKETAKSARQQTFADPLLSPQQKPEPKSPTVIERANYRARLTAFLTQYNPSKLDNVDKILDKYKGSEEDMFRKLYESYGVQQPLSEAGKAEKKAQFEKIKKEREAEERERARQEVLRKAASSSTKVAAPSLDHYQTQTKPTTTIFFSASSSTTTTTTKPTTTTTKPTTTTTKPTTATTSTKSTTTTPATTTTTTTTTSKPTAGGKPPPPTSTTSSSTTTASGLALATSSTQPTQFIKSGPTPIDPAKLAEEKARLEKQRREAEESRLEQEQKERMQGKPSVWDFADETWTGRVEPEPVPEHSEVVRQALAEKERSKEAERRKMKEILEKKAEEEEDFDPTKKAESISFKQTETPESTIQKTLDKAASICRKCKQPIRTDKVLKALQHTWHPDCFVCFACGKTFPDGQYIIAEGEVFCNESCNESRVCEKCQKLIRDASCATFLEKNYHTACFVCSICENPFPKGEYVVQEGEAICHSCIASAEPEIALSGMDLTVDESVADEDI